VGADGGLARRAAGRLAQPPSLVIPDLIRDPARSSLPPSSRLRRHPGGGRDPAASSPPSVIPNSFRDKRGAAQRARLHPDLGSDGPLILKRACPEPVEGFRMTEDGHLPLKAMLPMPTKKMRMRPIHRPYRHQCAPSLVDQAPHAVRVIHLPRHKHVEIVRKADQPAA
jgi:hypothetical protein